MKVLDRRSKLFELDENSVAIIGICSDENSSFLRGSADAPKKIREVLLNGSANLFSEQGVELNDTERCFDLGDYQVSDGEANFLTISEQIQPILKQGAKPLVLGGDHAITFPVLKAVAQKHGPVDILHFDAHPDLHDCFAGNRYSHACPFARIMEAGLASRLVQVGIRTLTDHQQRQADKFGVEIYSMQKFAVHSFSPVFTRPVYISFDVDALDPAYAPGVSHHEPGGLSVREVLHIIHNLNADIIGADIVEYNPQRDINDMTAMVAAKLLKELASKMLLNDN